MVPGSPFLLWKEDHTDDPTRGMGSDHQLVCDQCFEPSCVADPGLVTEQTASSSGTTRDGDFGQGSAEGIVCVACVSHAPCFEMHRGWKELEGSKTADL